MHTEWSPSRPFVEHGRCWLSAAAVAVLIAACSSSARAPEPAPAPRFIKAPPKVGTSITHTRMCECHACSPRSCCEGTDETQPSDPSCTTDYDFTNEEGCGISVRSCTTRCSKEIWRVKIGQDCASKRPATCCG